MDENKSIEPGLLFKTRIIHPENERVIARRARATALPPNVVRKHKRELHDLKIQLEKSGYYALYKVYQHASEEFNALLVARAERLEEHQLAPSRDTQKSLRLIHARTRALYQKILSIRPQLDAQKIPARRERILKNRLHNHKIALDQDRARTRAEREYTQEIHDAHDIIIETLTRLGFCWRFMDKGREVTRKVKIAEIHATADTYYFKIATTRKQLFGWVSELPRGVHPADIIDPRTCEALSATLQLQVEGVRTDNNGIWIKVHRMLSKDGLLNTVKYRACLALLDSPDIDRTQLPVVLGIGAGRIPSVVSVTEYPHFLIAGMAGSGKSNQIRNVIGTLISRHTPDQIRLVLVDMKEGTEFKVYEDGDIPHLLGNVITTPQAFLDVLSQLELHRIERSKLFHKVYATKLDEYNERVPTAQKIPRIMVIIDEFGAIYLNNPNAPARENKAIAEKIKALVRQLLAKARSAGIHLMICTQTPYVEILPGPDKANISVSNVFRLPTRASSMAVMDWGDAAELPQIPGRSYIITGGNRWMIQAPHVAPDDVQASIELSRLHPDPRPLVLPTLDKPAANAFTEQDLIKLSIIEYAGRLNARRMWDDGLKSDRRLTFISFVDMVKALQDKDNVEYNGVTYELATQQGGGRRLSPITPKITEQTPEQSGIETTIESVQE